MNERPESELDTVKDTKERAVYTVREVAKICKVAPRTVSKWFDSGSLKGYRIPGSQDRRIPRKYLEKFLEEHGMNEYMPPEKEDAPPEDIMRTDFGIDKILPAPPVDLRALADELANNRGGIDHELTVKRFEAILRKHLSRFDLVQVLRNPDGSMLKPSESESDDA